MARSALKAGEDHGSYPDEQPISERHLDHILQPLLKNESAFLSFLRRRIGDEALAEDLLQVLRNFPKYPTDNQQTL